MKREIELYIKKDIEKKIILLSGPRQSGKTTLAKNLSNDFQYLNYDELDHRITIHKKQWSKDKHLLILDELHKMPKWKQFLKGIYDVTGLDQKIIVTGSARLDTVKKMGDSLAGRHFAFRLFPFCLKELLEIQATADEPIIKELSAKQIFNRLLNVGGFPEPFLSGDAQYASRWRTSHLAMILRQDLLDLEQVKNIVGIETLVMLLRDRVGSTISMNSLANELQVKVNTVKNWLIILENLFVIFRVQPFSKNITRARTKSSKIYFFDTAQVSDNQGMRLENLVALSLYKELIRRQDCLGESWSLNYIRDAEKNEIDFIVHNSERATLLEAKFSDNKPHKPFLNFGKQLKFKSIEAIQLVAELDHERDIGEGSSKLKIRSAIDWLKKMDF